MSNGLIVINAENFTQIDGEYSNFNVIQEGLAYVKSSGLISNWQSAVINFPIQTVIPMVVVSPPIGKLLSCEVKYDNFRLISFYEGDNFYVPYKVLGVTKYNTASNESNGLRVYESDGSLAFDAGHQRFLTEKILQATLSKYSTSYGSAIITTNINKYFSVNGLGFIGSWEINGNESETIWACAGFNSATELVLSKETIFPDGPLGNTNTSGTYTTFFGGFNL